MAPRKKTRDPKTGRFLPSGRKKKTPRKRSPAKTRRKPATRKKTRRRRGPRAAPSKRTWPRGKAMTIQSIGFDKDFFTRRDAERWIRKHKKKLITCEETANFWWFAQRPKAQFYAHTIRTWAGGAGIDFVGGKLLDGTRRRSPIRRKKAARGPRPRRRR